MAISDYEQVFRIWQQSEGVGLSASDSMDQIEQYLSRNPGLSFVALIDKVIVGAILCGHDGRRGYIHHLAVRKAFRKKGIGRVLVEHCLEGLRRDNIQKCHLFVFTRNQGAKSFWRQLGFNIRSELELMSIFIEQME